MCIVIFKLKNANAKLYLYRTLIKTLRFPYSDHPMVLKTKPSRAKVSYFIIEIIFEALSRVMFQISTKILFRFPYNYKYVKTRFLIYKTLISTK